MKKLQKKLIAFLAMLLLLVGAFFVGMRYDRQSTKPTITSQLIEQQLVQAQDLVTTKYVYSNTSSFRHYRELNGWKVPFTTKQFILAYDGEIQAGIDMQAIEVQVKDQQIQITLPEVKVLSHQLFEDRVKVMDESETIFNPIRVSDYTEFFDHQKQEVQTQAIERGLLTEARAQAEASIREVIQLIPDVADRYQITFTH